MNHYQDISGTALARLQDEELCIVVVQGKQREARWSKHLKRFFFTSAPPGSVEPDEVEEWWSAGVKF